MLLILSTSIFLPFVIAFFTFLFIKPFSVHLFKILSNKEDAESIIPPFSTVFFICSIFSNFPVKIPTALLPIFIPSSIIFSKPFCQPSFINVFFIFITSFSIMSGNKYLSPISTVVFITLPILVSKKVCCSFSKLILLFFLLLCFNIKKGGSKKEPPPPN